MQATAKAASTNQSQYVARLHTLQFDDIGRLRAVKLAKEAGFDSRQCWAFEKGDAASKAEAKAECEKYAREWEAKLGVGIEACLISHLVTPITRTQALMAGVPATDAHSHRCKPWAGRGLTIMGRKAGTCIYCGEQA